MDLNTRGEFAINGFRNRGLLAQLFPRSLARPQEKRRASARVTQRFRLLRAHGIIRKVSHTHRYVLTCKGRQIATAVFQSQQITLQQLSRIAA